MKDDELRNPNKARTAATGERYLTFLLGQEQYAIPLLQVKEVIEMTETTSIPQTPSYFKGIINLRGQVISVLDLRTKLQMPQIENGPKTAIIILDLSAQVCLGIVVDRINSVLAFQHESMSPTPETMSTQNKYIKEIARSNDKMTLILDIYAALDLQDLDIVKQIGEKQAA